MLEIVFKNNCTVYLANLPQNLTRLPHEILNESIVEME